MHPARPRQQRLDPRPRHHRPGHGHRVHRRRRPRPLVQVPDRPGHPGPRQLVESLPPTTTSSLFKDIVQAFIDAGDARRPHPAQRGVRAIGVQPVRIQPLPLLQPSHQAFSPSAFARRPSRRRPSRRQSSARRLLPVGLQPVGVLAVGLLAVGLSRHRPSRRPPSARRPSRRLRLSSRETFASAQIAEPYHRSRPGRAPRPRPSLRTPGTTPGTSISASGARTARRTSIARSPSVYARRQRLRHASAQTRTTPDAPAARPQDPRPD